MSGLQPMHCRSKNVLFPNTFSAEIRKYGKRFTLRNILSTAQNVLGVYIFHHNHNFIYVGQSIRVKDRLVRHYNESHNEELAIWIKALDGNIKFTICYDTQIDDLERSLIFYLQPITNRERYLGYTPKHTKWRKTHG